MKTGFTLLTGLSLFTIGVKAQTFTKIITNDPLVITPGDSRSVNWIDINNDGFVDCQITNGPFGGQNNFLYLNNGTGGFTAVQNDTIVQDNQPSDGATWADYDNDGDLDCFVVNYYGVDNMFYTNDGSGNFTQISTGILVNDGGYSETASWGDYDNDGFVDLYVTNSSGNRKNYLYHNNGNGTFTKILSGAVVNDAFYSRCVNWTDIDGDNDLDLFVTNESNQDENIYRNDGGGVFTPLSTGALLDDAGSTMSSSWGDYDNDGDLDVFLATDFGSNALFRNDGNFVFVKIIGDTVSNTNDNSFSSAWSDVDNDGDLDLFVTNAFWTATGHVNYFYLNNGNGTFTRNGSSILATDSTWSYGCAFADYDNDGFEDLAVATTRLDSTDEADLLYHNDGNANHWITIKLTGTTTNRAAIGTKVRVRAIINGVPVWQMREVSAQTAYCSQNDLRVHFGLGNATVVDSIVIQWMDSTEILTNVNTDQFLSITQTPVLNGIGSLNKTNSISVFPNPTNGMVRLKNESGGFKTNDQVTVLDSNGKIVSEKLFTQAASETDIQLGGNRPGLYYIIIRSGTNRVVKTVVLN